MKTFSGAIERMRSSAPSRALGVACAASCWLAVLPVLGAPANGNERIVVAGLGSLNIFRDPDKDKSSKQSSAKPGKADNSAQPQASGNDGQRIRIEMPADANEPPAQPRGENMQSIIVPPGQPRAEAPHAVPPNSADASAPSQIPSMPEPEPSGAQVISRQRPDIVAGTDDSKPAFIPDAAFISVLKDISRSLKEPAELAKVEDPNQRSVVGIAQAILTKALAQPDLASDRIVRDRNRTVGSMSTEAWASGEVKLSEQCRGSLSAVWAKHENGLLNLTVAGECNDRPGVNGKRIGEFVVIIAAKSPIEKGFDIQTQSEVHFWIAKLQSISVESASATASKAGSGSPATAEQPASETPVPTRPIVLQPVITQRGRQYMAQVDSYNNQHDPGEAVTASPNIVRPNKVATAVPPARGPAKPAAPVDRTAIKAIVNEAALAQNPSLDSIKQPSAGASVVIPERAIAGEPVTVAVVGSNGTEPVVALEFNGENVYTDKRGLALYMVPEDATPGKSLHIALAARGETAAVTVDILHPLSVPTEHQPPKMDHILIAGGNRFGIIEGHNFEGYAQLNHVLLDNQYEAKVVAASPVQIKFLLPPGFQPGVHSIALNVAGLHSPAVAFKILPVQSRTTAARE